MATRIRRLSMFSLIAVALAAGTAHAADESGVRWRTNYESAVREARAKNLPLLVKFTADWCTWCHKMERTTYRDEGIAEHVNTGFVPVMVDADERTDLVKAMDVSAFPTTVLLSPEQKVLTRVRGFKKPEQLGPQLAAVSPLAPARTPARLEPPAPVQPPAPAAVVRVPDTPRVSFGGNCLVTLRDERRLAKGDPEITATYHGLLVAFASEEALEAFTKNPTHYWPMWDGRCPVTAIEDGQSVEGVPITGAIYKDRLWFFADREHRKVFDDSPARYLPTVAAGDPGTRTN